MARASPPRKAATNVSIRVDLVRRAKELGLNLSQLLEHALEQAIREREHASWLERNRDAIDDYNQRVEKHGVFSDTWRSF